MVLHVRAAMAALFCYAFAFFSSTSSTSLLNVKDTAKLFVKSRLQHLSIDTRPITLPEDATEADGYAVLNEYVLNHQDELGLHLGWKIGATNEASQDMLKFGYVISPFAPSLY